MDEQMLSLATLDVVAMDLQCIDTIGPYADKRQLAEAVVVGDR